MQTVKRAIYKLLYNATFGAANDPGLTVGTDCL